MDEDRKKKLQKLHNKNTINGLSIPVDGESFIKEFESKLDEIKSLFGDGVELTGTDEVIEKLAEIESLREPIKELRDQISKIKIPDIPSEVKVAGLDVLLNALKEKPEKFKIEGFDKASFEQVNERLDRVIKAVNSNLTITNKRPEDYVPYRRVIKLGNQYFFDDSSHGGGGGGGLGRDVTTKNGTAIAVTNPDGSNISGGAGGGSGDASAAKQDIGNASLASIDTKVDALTTPSDTQPISAASLPLPTGAAAESGGNLASIKTNTDKIPSQGQALAAASTPVVLPAAQITTLTPPAAITGYATSAKQDTLLTELQAKADLTETQPVSLASVPSHAVTNAGTFVTQENGAALTSLQLIDDTVFTDDGAFTPGTSKVNAIGLQADETSTDSVDEGDIGAPRMTLDRKQITTAYAHAAGGATPYKLVSAASTNATSVKGSAGTIYSISASNVNAAVRYLKLYNKATAPTVGTDVPVQTYAIPGNTAGAGTNIPLGLPGLNFSTGIAFALTTEATDAGTTGVAANEIVVNLGYA